MRALSSGNVGRAVVGNAEAIGIKAVASGTVAHGCLFRHAHAIDVKAEASATGGCLIKHAIAFAIWSVANTAVATVHWNLVGRSAILFKVLEIANGCLSIGSNATDLNQTDRGCIVKRGKHKRCFATQVFLHGVESLNGVGLHLIGDVLWCVRDHVLLILIGVLVSEIELGPSGARRNKGKILEVLEDLSMRVSALPRHNRNSLSYCVSDSLLLRDFHCVFFNSVLV